MLKQKVSFIFNDNLYSDQLKENFYKEFPDGTFPKRVHFGQSTVGETQSISDYLIKNTHINNLNDKPSLLFIDPFGYKGIETDVLAQFLKNWGNEIFLFVNTKRIHPALENEKFEGLMKDLFPSSFSALQNDRRYKATVSERLKLIIDSLGKEYEKILNNPIFYTAFEFKEEDSDATSHYILHITKGSRGFDLIKTIYNDFANVGTIFDGVNTYTFDAKLLDCKPNELFDINSMNIDKLKDELIRKYKGRKLSANELFEEHHTTGLYSRSHYTKALRRLVDENVLTANYTDGKSHIKTVLISKDCILTF